MENVKHWRFSIQVPGMRVACYFDNNTIEKIIDCLQKKVNENKKKREEIDKAREILKKVDFLLGHACAFTRILLDENNLDNSLLWGNTAVESQELLQQAIDNLKLLEEMI